MTHDNFYLRWLLVLLLLPFGLAAQSSADFPAKRPVTQALFDTHLHYSAADATALSPQDIIIRLDRNGIRYAAVTGTPASQVMALYRYAPDRILPLLSLSRGNNDKMSWVQDASLPPYVEAKLKLKQGNWRGIGELHIFAGDRHSTVFKRIVEMASRWALPLLIHGDPAVIDAVYEIAPKQAVIWAHAGTFPYPDLLTNYLQRYPALSIDLSMRDGRIAPSGQLDDAWYELFVTYPERFMVGVDTYSVSRWYEVDAVVTTMRNWLAQLPDDVAEKLAYGNAAEFFNK